MSPKTCTALLCILLAPCFATGAEEWTQIKDRSPLDELPPYITRITRFGQRADWSHDGKRILFIEKTYGDAYEIELATGIIRPMTHHYYHEGYTRALYLQNGDILLSGAPEFDAKDPSPSRHTNAELWVLNKDLSGPPVALGTKCSEGPAVSRRNMKIAWTIDHGDYPDRMDEGVSQIWMGDIVYEDGKPQLTNQKKVLDSSDLSFECGLETQNFRPPDEKEIIFSAYGYQGTEVMGVGIESGDVTNYSKAPNQYDEPEGIFPDGKFTCVECNKHTQGTHSGSQYIDIWKLALDGSGDYDRLTSFNDYEGYKASNPVISDDGRFMAFQVAKVGDPAGVGRGILICNLEMLAEVKAAEAKAAMAKAAETKPVGEEVPESSLTLLFGNQLRARRNAAMAQIRMLKTAVDMYELDTGAYPEGLQALIEAPAGKAGEDWRGPYIRATELEKDPWGNPYQYKVPGRNGKAPDIWSTGPDGKSDTDDDITSWK